MEEKKSADIILIPKDSSPDQIETSIAAFNEPLSSLLNHIGVSFPKNWTV